MTNFKEFLKRIKENMALYPITMDESQLANYNNFPGGVTLNNAYDSDNVVDINFIPVYPLEVIKIKLTINSNESEENIFKQLDNILKSNDES